MENSNNYWQRAIFFVLLFMGVILGFTILKILSSVLQPIVIAVLFAFLFFPLIKKLSRKLHIPFSLGIILVYILFFGFFFALSNILTSSIKSILNSYPQYEERISDIYQKISEKVMSSDSNFFSFFRFNKEQSLFENMQGMFNFVPTVKKLAFEFTGFMYTFLKAIFLIILFSIFFLAEMNLTQKKLTLALSRENKKRINLMVINIVSEVSRYISIKFIISLATGIFVFISSLIIKLDFPLVWGFLAFLMNFIPTFGSIISWLLTTLFAVLQFYPSPFPIIFISVAVLLINFILGNVVEPRIEGQNMGLSPFFILVGLSIWGYIWGIVGLFLAVPLTVILKIICENISFLHPIAIFIGTNSKKK